MSRLNIFVDETGNFGFGKDTSEIYGLSFVFHEQQNNINNEINALNERLKKIKYNGMIHTSELVNKRFEYSNYSLEKRKKIFNYLFQFIIRANIKFKTLMIDKKYCNNERQLKDKLSNEIKSIINNNKDYFNSFSKIVLYYDNGQEPIKDILNDIFSNFKGYEHKVKFDKTKKRLFQVADMLVYIYKYDYKYKNKLLFSQGEKYFLNVKEHKKIIKRICKKEI